MPVKRTCGKCGKNYTITNVDEISPQNTNRISVKCPYCQVIDGTIMATTDTSTAFTQKGWN